MKVDKALVGDKPEQVTEDYCIKVFNAGKAMQGYALYLAKTEVHRDKQVGWLKFLEKVSTNKDKAYRLIAFYEAQKVIASENIPENHSTYAELKGKTPQEKAQNYADIKKSTGKKET